MSCCAMSNISVRDLKQWVRTERTVAAEAGCRWAGKNEQTRLCQINLPDLNITICDAFLSLPLCGYVIIPSQLLSLSPTFFFFKMRGCHSYASPLPDTTHNLLYIHSVLLIPTRRDSRFLFWTLLTIYLVMVLYDLCLVLYLQFNLSTSPLPCMMKVEMVFSHSIGFSFSHLVGV